MTDISGRVRILNTEILSDDYYTLSKVTFSWKRANGEWQDSTREVYDRGDGCAILLFNREKKSVILTRQFRLPAFLNGYREMLIEAAAGLLDHAEPEQRVRDEAQEETGYRAHNVTKAFAIFMSPGAVTERLHLFTGEYDPADRVGKGGGLASEGEDIEVLELGFDEAMAMVADGRICDAKTIVLLQHAALQVFPHRKT